MSNLVNECDIVQVRDGKYGDGEYVNKSWDIGVEIRNMMMFGPNSLN
jgi:hypothetical protein